MLGSDAALIAAVETAVKESRRRVDRDAVLTVAVHQEDFDMLSATAGQAPGLRWVADDEVRLGGCKVTGSQGSLDARLETQLARLRDTLLEVRRTRKLQGARA
jgi:flagellar assembly protein FliH